MSLQTGKLSREACFIVHTTFSSYNANVLQCEKNSLVLRDQLALFPGEVCIVSLHSLLVASVSSTEKQPLLSQMIFEKVAFSFVRDASDLLAAQYFL